MSHAKARMDITPPGSSWGTGRKAIAGRAGRAKKRAAVLRDLNARGADLALMGARQWVIGDALCPFFFVYRRGACLSPSLGSVVTLQIFDAVTGKKLLPDPVLGTGTSIGFLPHQVKVLRDIFKPERKRKR